MTRQVEALFAHAYYLGDASSAPGFMCPLPPLRHLEVAAWVQAEAGATLEIWDPTFRVQPNSFEIVVSRLRPRMVWLYTHPTTRTPALQMVRAARRGGAVVFVGGPDAAIGPARYLNAGADLAVDDESAESQTLALLLALRASSFRYSPELAARVPGLVFRGRDGRAQKSEGESAPVDLDQLPRPLRDPVQTRIHLERWLDHRHHRALALRSARGCPGPCGYCSSSVFGRPYRRRSPGDVVAEMSELSEQLEIDRFVFVDEVFLFDNHWISEFAQALEREGPGIPFEARAHPAFLSPGMLSLLAEAGLVHVDLDAASGSSVLLKRLDWSYAPSDVYRAVSWIRKAGLSLSLQVLVGLPGESREDLDASLEMARLVAAEGVEVTRVDPDSPALFRKDWERLVEGSLREAAEREARLPSSVLDAAVSYLQSTASGRDPNLAFAFQGLVDRFRRPLLRQLVRNLPGFEFRVPGRPRLGPPDGPEDDVFERDPV